MPRERDECWQEVTRTPRHDENGKRHPRITCKHCLAVWTSNEKARVLEHLQRCPQLPEMLWRAYQPHRLDPTLPTAREVQQQQRARTRGITSMSTPEQEVATAACAHWINSAGLNPNVTEHPAFRAFMQLIRPGFRPPTRHDLTHALVDSPLMFIAYIADPQDRPRRPTILDSNEETQTRSLQAFLLKYCDNNVQRASTLLGLISLLRVKQGPFGNEMIWMASEHITPIQWWHNFFLEEHSDLAMLCIVALAVVPIGDSVERNWSPHSFMHILKQNQLNSEVVNRLMTSFWNLRIRHGWVDDGVAEAPQPTGHDADAEFLPDMDSFVGVQG